MPKFTYLGKTISGQPAKGEINAPNLADATAILRRQQIIPSTLAEKKSGFDALKEIKIPGFGGSVATRDIVIFTRQFATMIDAGLPLVQCLDILSSQQENPLFKKTLLEVKQSVEGGTTLADALRKHPKVFDDLFVNLVAAGEVGGILDTILNRLSGFMEKAEKLKGEVKGALTYPVVVILIAIVIVTGLLVFVVPIFEGMFAGFGKALPVPTQMVVGMSNAIKNYWYLIIGTVVGMFVGIKRYY